MLWFWLVTTLQLVLWDYLLIPWCRPTSYRPSLCKAWGVEANLSFEDGNKCKAKYQRHFTRTLQLCKKSLSKNELESIDKM